MAKCLSYFAYTCLACALLVFASLDIVGCSGGLAAAPAAGIEQVASVSVALAGDW